MQHADQLRISTEHQGDTCVVSVAGEVDIASAPQLRTHVNAALAAKPRRLVVDLSQTTYLDSSGIAELTRAGKALSGMGSSLVLFTGDSKVKKILDVLGLSRAFAPPEEGSQAPLR